MARNNITVKQNATYDITITVRQGTTHTPLDLTDYEGKGEIRLSYGATEVIASFTVTFPTPRTDGKVIFTLPYSVTAALDHTKQYVYDMTIKSPAPEGKVIRLLEGILTISAGVTLWTA